MTSTHNKASSPLRLVQDHLVQSRIGHHPAQPAVLRLEFLQLLHLIAFQPAALIAPAVTRLAQASGATHDHAEFTDWNDSCQIT